MIRPSHAGWWRAVRDAALGLAVLASGSTGLASRLDLSGYTDASGAISVQYQGDTVDPYFALQALWLAQSHGMDISAHAGPWARWLARAYTRTGQLGRYCRIQTLWYWCKPADADDASLALWLHFLHRLPAGELDRQQARTLQRQARRDLAQLKNPQSGLYRVSARHSNSLFMDNLEIWATRPDAELARAIRAVFWDPVHQRFHVSTQAEQTHASELFYPDAAAQIYPLLVGFADVPGGVPAHYRQWMNTHRAQWLSLAGQDFPWGVIAWVAWLQGDELTVRCWQQAALPHRHSYFWTVTDEVVAQMLPPPTSELTEKKDCT